jgi:hypothetical protein
MHKVEKKNYGYRLTLTGSISRDEMAVWVADSKRALADAPASFGVLVDMRGLQPLEADTKAVMEEGQRLYKMKGMTRSAVGVDSATLVLQFKRIAKETGIYEWERYFDASESADWEKAGVGWIEKEIDPEG